MHNNNLIFTRTALRELDRRAVEEFGIPILVLMENAGRAVADAARKMLSQRESPGIAIPGLNRPILILTGPGNNGGDGLVAARWLHNDGFNVSILLLADRANYKNAAATQLKIIEAMKLPIKTATEADTEIKADLIIDAIFGTGLTRPIDGLAAKIIHAVNTSNHPILAIDIPSGLDADIGEALGVAIRATETVSFCGTKLGFLRPQAKAFTGHVTLADIGAPRALMAELANRVRES